MKKSVTKNYIYNLIYQLLILIIPLVTTPYISRVLGAENIGIYSYTISISTYFILFGSLGIALYAQREIAYNQEDKKKYSILFWEIALLRTITMSISILLFYIIFVKGEQYQSYYKILLIEIIGNCLDISWFFQGLEEFKRIVLRNIFVKFISVFLIFLLVKTSNDIYIYFCIYTFSILIGNISLWFYLPKYLQKVNYKECNIFKHLKPTINLFIPQIAAQIYTVLDKTMIGAMIPNKSEVGFYDQSQKIIKLLLTVITSLGIVMLPRIANAFRNGQKNQIHKYMKKSFNIVFLLAFPMIFGIIVVSKNFVPVFFGQGYDEVVILMNIICPIILLIGISNVLGTQYLLPTKRQKEYTISIICGATVNIIINSCLIKQLGAIGASVGTIIAELTVTLVQIYYVRKEISFFNIIKLIPNYLISSVVMFCACILINRLINDNFISIIVQFITGILTYGICLIILKDEFLYELIEKITKKIARNEK